MVMKHEVRSPWQALAYMIDCTLATVADLALTKRRSKREYSRQIAIAKQDRNHRAKNCKRPVLEFGGLLMRARYRTYEIPVVRILLIEFFLYFIDPF